MQNDLWDMVVVGAGIVGITTANELAKAYPEQRILLLDQDLPGHGATRYSIGMDFPYGQTSEKRAMSATARDFYRKLKAEDPQLKIYRKAFYGIIHRDKVPDLLAASFDGVRLANQDEIEFLFREHPGLQLSEDDAVLTGCEASYANTLSVSLALLDQFRSAGNSEVYEGAKVVQVHQLDDGVELQLEGGTSLQTQQLVLATGPWLPQNLVNESTKVPSLAVKKIVCFNLSKAFTRVTPMIYFFDHDTFLMPTPERGGAVLSISSKEWNCQPNSASLNVNADELADKEKVLNKYYPELLSQVVGNRVFCDAYRPDFTAIAQPLKDHPNIVIAGGGSGSGFRLAPAIALSVVDQFNHQFVLS